MLMIVEEAKYNIGLKINEIIQKKGITARYLASKTGVTYRKIRYILKGDIEPTLSELKAICIYLKIKSSSLLDF